VALGELGARLLTRDGRTAHHFDVPAHRLVVSDHGDRAIALALRGEAVDLWRLDLLQRRAARWCTARVDAYARDYDGSLWFVSIGDEVFALDALAPAFKALWRVSRVGGPVGAIARQALQCHFVVGGPPWERWTLELPALVLRRRSPLEVPERAAGSPAWSVGQSPDGETGLLQGLADTGEGLRSGQVRAVVHQGSTLKHDLLLTARYGLPRTPTLSGEWLAAPLVGAGGLDVLLLNLKAGSLAARFRLSGTREAAVRLGGMLLTLADDRGRLLVFDLAQKNLLRDLRL
jgi:hypothetical protein